MYVNSEQNFENNKGWIVVESILCLMILDRLSDILDEGRKVYAPVQI